MLLQIFEFELQHEAEGGLAWSQDILGIQASPAHPDPKPCIAKLSDFDGKFLGPCFKITSRTAVYCMHFKPLRKFNY